MSTPQQAPPPDRILRGVTSRMDQETRVYVGRRIAELNTAKRRLEAEKKNAAAHFKALEKDLDMESLSLESAPPVPNGKEVELIYPCEGRVNLTTGTYDIYVLERDDEGREFARFARSESLPEKYQYLLQENLPFEKKGDEKKKPKRGEKKDDDGPPPGFPGEKDN